MGAQPGLQETVIVRLSSPGAWRGRKNPSADAPRVLASIWGAGGTHLRATLGAYLVLREAESPWASE